MASEAQQLPAKPALQEGESFAVTASTLPAGSRQLVFDTAGMVEPNPLCAELPVFNLQPFLAAQDRGSPELQRLCQAMAQCMLATSALVIRDPRVDSADNERFLSLMERCALVRTECLQRLSCGWKSLA